KSLYGVRRFQQPLIFESALRFLRSFIRHSLQHKSIVFLRYILFGVNQASYCLILGGRCISIPIRNRSLSTSTTAKQIVGTQNEALVDCSVGVCRFFGFGDALFFELWVCAIVLDPISPREK